MEGSPQLLWEQCLRIIKDNVTEQQYKTWFAPIECASYQDGKVVVQVPSQFVYEYLEEHYVGLLHKVLNRVFGEGTQLMYSVVMVKKDNTTVDLETSKRTTATPKARPITDGNKAPHPLKATMPQDLDPNLNTSYNFDNFIEGISNKLPRSVGQSIAENPKQSTFNPLFIYGSSGVGKTHLVNAIGTKLKELHPEKRVLYLSAHLFYVQFTNSVRNNTVNDFINFYQTIDVLIIDDIQELAGYTKTQNTFFHIFNHLHLNGKKIILTSDRPPIALQGMEERLLTRFKWGLLAELEKPNQDLRKAILKSKVRRDGLNIPEDIINYISENVNNSIRDIEGVVTSLLAYSVVYNREIDMAMAEQAVKRVVKIENKPITVEHIMDTVCDYFKVKQEDIFTSSRKQAIVQVRQISMYFAQKYTNLSAARIGTLIGKRNHATVLHSCNQVLDRIHVDKNFKSKLEELDRIINKKKQA
ncbi:MAG: chromosomal replication initiator protein DnaA [Paraprevotella sp.]|nr:chromosomal replication initiator protein DnaA [Paraprevotella sp.]